jgi:hypothetical protein
MQKVGVKVYNFFSFPVSQKRVWVRLVGNNGDFIYFYSLGKEIMQFQKVKSHSEVKISFGCT